jgi:hypothetical protein
MCDRLKEMTQRVNTVMGRNYNTILMNVYKDNKDCFAAHQDNENGWVKGTGFGTLAFGCERPFVIREIATKDRRKLFISQGDDRITVSYEYLLHASSSSVLKGVGRRVAYIIDIPRDRRDRVWGV